MGAPGAVTEAACHSGVVEPHDLGSLAATYGDALVNLETFATLSGVTASGLRSRSRPSATDESDPRPQFPAPIVSSGRPQFRLGSLVEWLTPEGVGTPDPAAVADWALGEALARCAAEFGSDVALKILGATALLARAGWSPDDLVADGGGAVRPTPLLAQVRAAVRSGERRVPVGARLPAGFVPDPDPITDPVVGRLLLEDLPTGRGSRPGVIDLLITEVVGLRQACADDRFVAEVEERLVPGAGDTGRPGRRRTGRRLVSGGGDPSARARMTPASDTALTVALVGVAPGHVLLDPAVGVANALVAAVDRTAAPDGAQTIGVVGRELDERTWLLAKIRLGLRGIAHQLGAPRTNSLDDPTLTGPFDRIVVDPGDTRVRDRWCDLVLRLLGPDGRAVARFGVDDVLPPGRDAPERGWWERAAGVVAAIVVTARYPSSPSGSGMFVLTRDAGPNVLLAQVYAPPPSKPVDGGPTQEQWVEEVAGLVTAGLARGGAVVRDGWSGATFLTVLPELSTEAMGGIARDDLESVRRWKEDFLGIAHPDPEPLFRKVLGAEAASDEDVMYASSPPPPSRRPLRSKLPRKTRGDDPVRDEALAAVAFLRALLDPDAPIADDPRLRAAAAERSRFAPDVTEEMRRALGRLERRLRGEERRGRPRSVPEPDPEPGSDPD